MPTKESFKIFWKIFLCFIAPSPYFQKRHLTTYDEGEGLGSDIYCDSTKLFWLYTAVSIESFMHPFPSVYCPSYTPHPGSPSIIEYSFDHKLIKLIQIINLKILIIRWAICRVTHKEWDSETTVPNLFRLYSIFLVYCICKVVNNVTISVKL